MRVVLQRVTRARVRVRTTTVAEIDRGLVVLVGIGRDDEAAVAERLASKIARLRLFAAEGENFDRSLVDLGAAALVVSQFTLLADTTKGTRPSLGEAARPALAEPVYEAFCAALRALGVPVETGIFGARMEVELVNDGPVTLVLSSSPTRV